MKVLEVSEGGRALITSEHLKVVVEYGFYGIPESGVLFHMAEAPSRGRLDVTVWDRKDDNIFTLVDLNTDQVSTTFVVSYTDLISAIFFNTLLPVVLNLSIYSKNVYRIK